MKARMSDANVNTKKLINLELQQSKRNCHYGWSGTFYYWLHGEYSETVSWWNQSCFVRKVKVVPNEWSPWHNNALESLKIKYKRLSRRAKRSNGDDNLSDHYHVNAEYIHAVSDANNTFFNVIDYQSCCAHMLVNSGTWWTAPLVIWSSWFLEIALMFLQVSAVQF